MICEEIKKIVESSGGVEDIGIKTRNRKLASLRFVFFTLCRKLVPSASVTEIGNVVNRDHSTVSNGIKKFKDLVFARDKDKYFIEYKELYNRIHKSYYFTMLQNTDNLRTIKEVKQFYLIKHIRIIEQNHQVIKKLQKRISELKYATKTPYLKGEDNYKALCKKLNL